VTPRSVERPGFDVAGIAVETSNARERDPAAAQIPGLWKRFFDERIGERIGNRVSPEQVLGVYTRYESDVNGRYTLLVGAEVDGLEQMPPGLVRLTIPSARYLVFEAVGRMPSAILETWSAVWSYFSPASAPRRAYTADFELYDVKTPERVEVHIAVK
jgi:predicted transcriptional regulator YdeE